MLPRVLNLIFPFALGFVLYLMCRRSVRRMAAAGLNRGLGAGLALFFMLSLVLGFCAAVFFFAYGERYRLPQIFRQISAFKSESSLLQGFLSTLSEEMADAARSLSRSLLSHMSDITGAVMILFFAFLSAFFFLRDEERLVDIISRHGGGNLVRAASDIGLIIRDALGGYVRAQVILMAVTFGVLSVFLVLFGVKNAVLIALGTAFLDAIPVFGTGFVLLPWAAWQFLTGSTSMAFGLTALYGVCSLIRQILEPRILSAQIGLHPLLTLAGIFVGFKLFGLPGLVLGPAAVMVIVSYIQKIK